jgi:hydroxymethylglutaryl-CoA synthase
MEHSYHQLRMKLERQYGQTALVTLQNMDFTCFHCPFTKMVQKAFWRLEYIEISKGHRSFSHLLNEEEVALIRKGKFSEQPVQTLIQQKCAPEWKAKVEPTLLLARELGNIYTGSLYAGLVSLIANKNVALEVPIFCASKVILECRISEL